MIAEAVAAWPHQTFALAETTAALEAGETRVCVTSPTGGGKSRMMVDIIDWAQARHMRVALYTNRRMLLDQTRGVLERNGIFPGVRASGHETALLRDVQLCMTQTEGSQVLVKDARTLHDARIVLVDEAHLQTGGRMEEIAKRHVDAGATIVGYTATPLDLGSMYERLIQAGTTSELRECGALLPCVTYGPDEPDTRHIKRQATGEFSEGEIRKVIMTQHIFGRVYECWKRLNPDALPALLFAPGVKESVWFAQEFAKQGVRAAHIDGDDIWLDGELHRSEPDMRAEVMRQHRDGEIAVVCNRFVLREGIDAPWVYHGIFATVFGGLASYLQSGGRLLRNYPGMPQVILQDHGGNWHRHGSLNEDRVWALGDTNYVTTELREERMREKKDAEPIVCPKCSAVRRAGRTCLKCGFEHEKSVRMVVQKDGELKAQEGDIYKARRVRKEADTEELWKRMYYRMKKAEMTFRQAEGLFFYENHYWVPRDLPLMPTEPLDWFRKVCDVPKERLM